MLGLRLGASYESSQQALVKHMEAGMKRSGATAAALYVVTEGTLVGQWYAGRHRHTESSPQVGAHSRFNVYSVRKSYIGFVIAYLLQSGQLSSIDIPLQSLLEDANTALYALTTVRHLLTHTHGLDEKAGRLVRRFPAGTSWHYTNAGVTILCRVVERITGKTVRQLLRELVWTPGGFTETDFLQDYSDDLVQDVNHLQRPAPWEFAATDGAGRNLFVSASELAAWGYLHLSGGQCPNGTVLERELFTPVSTVQTPASLKAHLPRQGFFWWIQNPGVRLSELGKTVPVGSYQIVGMNGCLCLVIPALQTVAVRMYNSLGRRLLFVREARAFGDAVVAAVQGHHSS